MARIKREMPLYEFLEDSGNKKAGEIFPLSPEVAPGLLQKGIIRLVNGEKKPKQPKVKKEKIKEPAKRGRKKKK